MADKRTARILARSLIRELWRDGQGRDEVVNLASALIEELSHKMRDERESRRSPMGHPTAGAA